MLMSYLVDLEQPQGLAAGNCVAFRSLSGASPHTTPTQASQPWEMKKNYPARIESKLPMRFIKSVQVVSGIVLQLRDSAEYYQ